MVGAIDKVYHAYQRKLLRDYRNWVTHRGAPQVVWNDTRDEFMVLTGRHDYPIPEEIKSITDTKKVPILLNQHIVSKFSKEMQIISMQFVPPLQHYFGATVQNAPTDINIGNIVSIAKSEHKTTIGEIRVSRGTPFSTKEEYEALNPVTLERNTQTFAGECVVEYGFNDYTSAVGSVVSFMQNVVERLWDEELLKACSLYYQKN